MLPELIDVGQRDHLLPPGIHPASLEDVATRFVNTTPKYQRRVELWAKYLRFRTLVAGFVTIEHEFLDGSFVTSKGAPKDIDLSIWVQAAEIDALPEARQAAFEQVWAERLSHFSCDAYLVPVCDPGHPLHDEYVYWKSKTESSWPAYKNRAKVVVPGVVKGYVEVVTS